ncbi:MAG: Arc family DNA binding domain-containing protein [Verrucomicrobia bacterium]|nr:Arc family DNA binding domain-containing protein [Verrucomicrobiota bacterium]
MESRKSFLLRVDPKLWRELERWAADELRSVNGQVEWILREAVRRRTGSGAGSDSDGGRVGGRRNPVRGAAER